MVKTTVYLPAELEARLNSEAGVSGISKAELIREGIALRLERSAAPIRPRELPVFNSGHRLTAEQMDQLAYEHMKQRSERR